MNRLIAFDYGRTLFDRDTDEENERIVVLKEAGIYECFSDIRFVSVAEEKDEEYQRILDKFGLDATDLVIVDDYVIRGIAWGDKAGATTIWFQNGRFSKVYPNACTGQPTYTIHSLAEMLELL